MTIWILSGIGLAFLLAGWLLGRWAESYDVKGWIVGALWRAVFRREWRAVVSDRSKSLTDADPILKRQISEKVESFKADSARLGTTRATVKHGGLYALAQAANAVAGPMKLIGVVLLAYAGWRWWS